jgi:transposase
MVPAPLAIIASFVGGRQASGPASWMRWPLAMMRCSIPSSCVCTRPEPVSREIEGRSRGGLTKIHAVVDAAGLPVQLGLTPGEAHDNRRCPELLARLQSQSMLLADRGYDADWIRALVKEQGAWRCPMSRRTFIVALGSAAMWYGMRARSNGSGHVLRRSRAVTFRAQRHTAKPPRIMVWVDQAVILLLRSRRPSKSCNSRVVVGAVVSAVQSGERAHFQQLSPP